MFSHNFSLSEVKSTLSRIVKRHGPGHVAQSNQGGIGCVYTQVKDGVLVPICIVGQFFADYGLLGMLVNHAPELGVTDEPEQYGSCNNQSLWDDLRDHGITFDVEAQNYLIAAQASQDRGSTWGTALTFADDTVMWQAQEATRVALGLPYAGQPERYDDKYIALDREHSPF